MNKELLDYLNSGSCRFSRYIIIKTNRETPYTEDEIGSVYTGDDGVDNCWFYEFDFKDADILCTPLDKLNFCIALNGYTLVNENDDTLQELFNIKKEIYTNISYSEISEEDLLKTQLSQLNIIQFKVALETLNIDMREFIKNPKYILVINKDNMFNNLADYKLLNTDMIEDIIDFSDIEYEKKYF